MPNAVHWTEPVGVAPHLGREEAETRHQYYIGPEHLLVGLLRQREFLRQVRPLEQGDDPAADLLRAHGLDLPTVRAGITRLVAERVLPGPQLSDKELLATLGIDLDAVEERFKDFGWESWYDAAQWLRLRRVQPLPHAPGGGTPLTCHRVLLLACEEAVARGAEVGPLHLLLGLLRDAERPVDEGLSPGELRLRSMLGLPNSGSSPIKLLVEHEGLTLEGLQAAVRAALDDNG
jgi:hypothetical protein